MTSQVPKDAKAILGANIRRARQSKGLSQVELAIAAGIKDGQMVSTWERGVHLPSGANMEALVEALEVDHGWLYTDHDTEEVAA